jgi:hypothetical protein
MGNRFLKENRGEFVKLLEKESGIHDPVVARLIHEEITKFYSDNGMISDEAMHELIANAKEVLKISRDVSFSEIADLSFTRKAAGELPASRQ